MNWEAVAAIAQLVSSVAVVLSVLYLGIQVHRSTRVAMLATQDAAATAMRDVTKPFMENAELERIWRVGLEDLECTFRRRSGPLLSCNLPILESV